MWLYEIDLTNSEEEQWWTIRNVLMTLRVPELEGISLLAG